MIAMSTRKGGCRLGLSGEPLLIYFESLLLSEAMLVLVRTHMTEQAPEHHTYIGCN